MKKLLAGLFALMALGFVLSGCKKDDDDDDNEEVFTELAESDFDNAEEWLLGSWYGEMEEFDFDCSDSFAEKQGTTKDEIKNMIKEQLTSQLSEEGENLLGDMEITEDNISKYIKFFHEMSGNDDDDDDNEITSDLKLSVNEDKTKFRILMNMEQSVDDMWMKVKIRILCTKK